MTKDQVVSKDPRHNRRIKIVQLLYASEYKDTKTPDKDADIVKASSQIQAKKEELYGLIATYAPKYPVEQIAKTDRAILLLALYELLYEKDTPSKVVINEAIELAHELGSDRSYAFVNAVLGAVLENI